MGGQVPGKRGAAALHPTYQHELRPRSAIDQPEAWVIQGERVVLIYIHVWATNLDNENYLALSASQRALLDWQLAFIITFPYARTV
jgi:hypothetical protein